MDLTLRSADEADLPHLGAMNKRLIEDEGSRNPMDVEQLQRRMAMWLGAGWSIDLFLFGEAVIGYVVYQRHQDDYDPRHSVIYLRHFYIERGQRRRGMGRSCFRQLVETRFPAECTVTLDVLAANTGGRKFWDSLGFAPYSITMKLSLPPSD